MNPATSHVQNERLHLTLPTTAEFVDLKRKIWIRDGALNELRKMVRNLKDEANLQQQQHHRELCELRDRNREVEGRLEDVERQLIARTAERDRVTERWQQLRAPIRAIPNLLAMTPHNPPLELVGTHSENIGHEGAGCGGSNNADASADAGVGVMGSSLHDGGTIIFRKGDVVVVKRPRKIKFATVLDDVTADANHVGFPSPCTLRVLFLAEIQPIDCVKNGAPTPAFLERDDVHFLTHINRIPTSVRSDQLVYKNGRCLVVEWEDGDIWDHMFDGSFNKVAVEEFTQRSEPCIRKPGVKGTLFLLDRTIFEDFRENAGLETRRVEKRPLLWPTNPIDERAVKKKKQ